MAFGQFEPTDESNTQAWPERAPANHHQRNLEICDWTGLAPTESLPGLEPRPAAAFEALAHSAAHTDVRESLIHGGA